MNKTWRVGILLFNEVEVLDFAGPFEVFSVTNYKDSNDKPFTVHTVAENSRLIKTRNGLLVQPEYDFSSAPDFDILIVPGGYGAEEIEIHNKKVISWIEKYSKKVDLLASVCTGAFLLAEAGLLNGKVVTTHWMDINRLEKDYPEIMVKKDIKFVDNGNIITSAGISAGIDMSLYIVSKLTDLETAELTARQMEYDWKH